MHPGALWRRTVILLALVALGMLVALPTCSRPMPVPLYTLRMGIARTVDDLSYFVMQAQGFATQHRLHLVEHVYPSGPALIQALVDGLVDVSANIGPGPMLDAAADGLVPGTLVAVGANSVADPDYPALAVLAAASLTSWSALIGQYIAVNGTTSFSAMALHVRLQQEAVRDVTLVETAFPNMGLSVAGGNVAAAVLAEPWLTQSLLRGDGRLLGWIVGGAPFPHLERTMLVCRTAVARHTPQAVQAWLRAHVQAVQWILQHPALARALLAQRLGLSPEVAQKMQLLHWPVDARNNPALLDGMQPLLVTMGLLKAPLPAHHLYDATLLNAVLAEQR